MLKGSVKTIFIIAALLFMAAYIRRAVGNLEYIGNSWNVPALFLSAGIVLLGFVVVISIWRMLLRSYGDYISFADAYRIYFRSNLGKYLPGKVWQLAGMVVLCREIGIRPAKSLPASLYNTGIAALSGILLFMLTVPAQISPSIDRIWLTVAAVAVVLLLTAFPDILTWFMNRALRMLGKEEIEQRIGRPVLLCTIAAYIVAWLVFGWGFLAFLKFLGLAEGMQYMRAAGVFSGAISIGFVAFFAPGGIGVREGVMVFLLESSYPLATALFISIAARLWMTGVELIGFLSTYLLHGTRLSRTGMGEYEKSEQAEKTQQ